MLADIIPTFYFRLLRDGRIINQSRWFETFFDLFRKKIKKNEWVWAAEFRWAFKQVLVKMFESMLRATERCVRVSWERIALCDWNLRFWFALDADEHLRRIGLPRTGSARQRPSLERAPAASGWLSVDLPVGRMESSNCEEREWFRTTYIIHGDGSDSSDV